MPHANDDPGLGDAPADGAGPDRGDGKPDGQSTSEEQSRGPKTLDSFDPLRDAELLVEEERQDKDPGSVSGTEPNGSGWRLQ